MRIISYDIASKSLAVAIIDFNENWEEEIKNISTELRADLNCLHCLHCLAGSVGLSSLSVILEKLNKINDILDVIKPVFFDVVDLIPGKKLKETDVILRAARLKAFLTTIDSYVCDSLKILLEFQMGPNDKSRNVGSQILYHYSNVDYGFKSAYLNKTGTTSQVSIEIIGPSLKNKINLDPDNTYQSFIHKYAKTYDANKKHSIANMMFWLNKTNIDMISKIKKSNYDDIADAITMTLAWIYLKYKKN